MQAVTLGAGLYMGWLWWVNLLALLACDVDFVGIVLAWGAIMPYRGKDFQRHLYERMKQSLQSNPAGLTYLQRIQAMPCNQELTDGK